MGGLEAVDYRSNVAPDKNLSVAKQHVAPRKAVPGCACLPANL